MTARRSYEQFCGLATALDVVGERWSALIVRDLAIGPQRYSDLLARLPGLSTALLADRLKHLQREGLVERTQLPSMPVEAYALTPDGHRLADALLPLAAWGVDRLEPADDLTFHADWLLWSLRAFFDAGAAAHVTDTYEFRVGEEVVHVMVRHGTLDVGRGPAPYAADVVITTDPATLLAVGTGRMTVDAALQQAGTEVTGDPDALLRCVALFARPPGGVDGAPSPPQPRRRVARSRRAR